MSNKLSSKPSKKDRPRSTDKSIKTKKRDGGTPDKLSTPLGSAIVVPDEVSCGPTTGKVISGDDIDSLAINIEELKKIQPPRKPKTPKPTTTVMVRKARLKKPLENEQPSGKSITVARPAPVDDPIVSMPLLGSAGPTFDDNGQVHNHSLLGSWDDFQQEAINRGELENLPPFTHFQIASEVRPTSLPAKRKNVPSHVWQSRINESNSLANWQRQMIQRKKQQLHLSNLLNTRSDMLVMNQSEEYRRTQEQRYIIDRSIPTVDYGKGYRVGSEFWKQVEQIGNDETGITMTLTQTERGYAPPTEHIGKAITIKKEMGIEWSSTHRAAAVHYPWDKSAYLQQRTQQLSDVMQEVDPYQPYLDELEVIGTCNPPHGSKFDAMSTVLEEEEPTPREVPTDRDPLAAHPDVIPQPIFGPSLAIGGYSAQWTGSTNSGLGQVGVACRVTCEANVSERTTSRLHICNDGTSAVYYSWKKVPKANTLGTQLAGKTQRFYFDTNSGVILPGDTLNFPFTFKSPNAGVYTETWELLTQPVLCGGAAIRVTLRGIALEEDVYQSVRQEIEQDLAHREAVEAAARILEEILDGVRTPERPATPVDAYITEEEIFTRKNDKMYFHSGVIEELKEIYTSLEEGDKWDLCLESLTKRIMEVEEDEQREELLSRLNLSIASLSFPPLSPVQQAMYNAGYQLLIELVDNVVGQAGMIRAVLGLPERELVEDTSQEEEKRSRKATNSESKLDPKKADKKDRKGGKLDDRPTSTQRSKLSAKKSGRGTTTPSSQSKSVLSEVAADRLGTPASPDALVMDTMDPVTEAKYKEKLFAQTYSIMAETFDRMDVVFGDINDAPL